MELKLLKLQTGVGKNGKEYYRIMLLVGNETISTFIWDNQYNAILNSLSEEDRQRIVVTRNH